MMILKLFNLRRIINTINNYTETISDFIVSPDFNELDQLNEIKNIRLSIDYFKQLIEHQLQLDKNKQEELRLIDLANKKSY